MATIDVLIPCYNYGRFLRDCVTSVLAQSVEDLRILIIDDASADHSSEVAQQLASEDRRVEFVRHLRNRGHIATYNEGIDWAVSDYFMLLSADDLVAPGAFRRATAVMAKDQNVTLTYGAAVELHPGDTLPRIVDAGLDPEWQIEPGPKFIRTACSKARNDVVVATAIVRTSAQKQVGYYRPELPHSGDLEMWLRLAAIGSVAETSAIQGVRRTHGSNMSAVQFGAIFSDYVQREAAFASFFDRDGWRIPDGERLRRLANHRLASQAYWAGLAQYCRGNQNAGRDIMNFAYRVGPVRRFIPPVTQLFRTSRIDRRILSAMSCRLNGPGRNAAT